MLKFKTPKLKQQFYDIAQTDPRLRGLAGELAFWVEKLFYKDLIITCVWRRPQEQEAIYGQPKPSAHFCLPQCRAVDIRAKGEYFTPEELENMDSFVKKYFPRRDGLSAVLFHGQGDNFHLHLSVEPLPD